MMTELVDWPPFIEVETSELIAETYQRPADEKRVAKIVGEFDLKLFGALVTAATGMQYALIDGQHRWRVAQELALETVWVQLHEGLSYEERARMFVDLQRKRKNLTPIERFKAELEAGDEQAHAIREMVENSGFRLVDKPDPEPDSIRAVVGLEGIYSKDPQALAKTLIVAGNFPKVAKFRASNHMLRGIGRFVLAHPDAEPDLLSEKLENAEMNPTAVIQAANQLQKLGNESMTICVQMVMESVWNGKTV
jgi:hypothetical protein